jgi:hypothetical protein
MSIVSQSPAFTRCGFRSRFGCDFPHHSILIDWIGHQNGIDMTSKTEGITARVNVPDRLALAVAAAA